MSIDLNQKFILRSSGIGVRLWKCIFKVPGDASVAGLKTTVHTNSRTLNGLKNLGQRHLSPACICPLTGVRLVQAT